MRNNPGKLRQKLFFAKLQFGSITDPEFQLKM
jgi:hypothetical protein